jgi:ATP-dependent DNA ligase
MDFHLPFRRVAHPGTVAQVPTVPVERPPFVTIPLSAGLCWHGGGGWRYEEKMDGVWSEREFRGSTIIGEQMRDGRFYAFDIIKFEGADIRALPLVTRLEYLGWTDPMNLHFLRPASGNGAEFLEAVLARGGEGVVAKLLDAPYGTKWFRCKRVVTFDLVVTEKAIDRHSLRLGTLQGEDRGWCPCFEKYATVRVGDVVEVAAHGLNARGMLREPRFVRMRPDKATLAGQLSVLANITRPGRRS